MPQPPRTADLAPDADCGTLNDRHGLAGVLQFRRGPGGLAFADIRNRHARATVCLQGGQLLDWQPYAQSTPALWLSQAARYAPGQSIRGGIPVCWPWFGPSAAAGGPAHGFARNRAWAVVGAGHGRAGQTCLRLQLRDCAQTRQRWPHAFVLTLEMRVGACLFLTLETHNASADAVVVSEALHSYFRVGDIAAARVLGLDGAHYADTAAGGRRHRQSGAVAFAQEVDRLYDSTAGCRIDDPVLRRSLLVRKRGSGATVVWNPWADKAARLGDLGAGAGADDGWRQMVCVESANAGATALLLAPGARHRLQVRYGIVPWPAGCAPAIASGT